MPLDAYSLCPGGTGKKIKFCCPDLVGELETIQRMMEGEQNEACLQHIDRLLQQHPDRACLLATKTHLLRVTGRTEELAAAVDEFRRQHPDNPIALAESAIQLAATRKSLEAVAALQQILAASTGPIDRRVYEAIGAVGVILLNTGQWLSGRALLQLQLVMAENDSRPVEALVELNHSSQLPLLFKDDHPLATCPDDAPWKARFEEAMSPLKGGNWQLAAEKLTALAKEDGASPAIWRNLATLRGWLADRPGCIEALRVFASLDVPLEEAVEAQATAMLYCDDPLEDPLEMLNLLWEIKDIERVEASFPLDARTTQVPFDLSSLSDEENPPPRSAYLLLDRPVPKSTEDVTWQSVSLVLGEAIIYGRQTDREARLEMIGVKSENLEKIEALLKEMVGDALDREFKTEVMARVSASQELLQNNWHPPDGLLPQRLEELAAEYRRHALLDRWPDLKLGTLDGKSPREAVQDETYRVKVLAAIAVLESWIDQMPGTFDFNELRSELGLPTFEPIDPNEVSINSLPLVRLSRVMVEKLSDNALVEGFRRAVSFGVTPALGKFARAVIDRPSVTDSETKLRAYHHLSQKSEDPNEALQYIEQGRALAISAGQSCAAWDLMELPLRVVRSEGDEVSRLVQHLQQQHIEEPGVSEALMQFLVRIGAIHPDGTPVAQPRQQAPPTADSGQGAAETGKLWTPGGEEPGGEKKLWTPD